MNVIWQEFQETIDKLIDVTICFPLELKQMKCYCVSKKNFFWDHVTINWRKNITACLRTMINYTCLTYPSVLCDVSHLQFYQDLNKHKFLKKHFFVYLQEKCMHLKSSITMKQLSKVNICTLVLRKSLYTLMIFVIILFWNWMFLPKQTFAWSPFIILSSSYIALSPLKKKQQNIFFLKLQCEKEGENAIKHKYFMSKIQVRKSLMTNAFYVKNKCL